MEWKEKTIKSYYDTLLKQKNHLSTEIEKYAYSFDMGNIQNMFNYLEHKKMLNIDQFENILDKDYYNAVYEWLKSNSSEILSILLPYNNKFLKNNRDLKNTKITEEDASRIVYLFFTEHNSELKNKLQYLNRNNMIHYDNGKYRKASSCTFNLVNLKESFILLRLSSRLDSSMSLVRSITDVSEFDKASDIISVQNNNASPFKYAYSKFNELLFIDYLKENGYEKEAESLKVQRLNRILYSVEGFNENYLTLNKEKDGYYIPYIVRSIISDLVSIYWYNNYQINPKLTLEEIKNFNLLKGKTDIEYFNKDLIAEVGSSFDEYRASFTRKRK